MPKETVHRVADGALSTLVWTVCAMGAGALPKREGGGNRKRGDDVSLEGLPPSMTLRLLHVTPLKEIGMTPSLT